MRGTGISGGVIALASLATAVLVALALTAPLALAAVPGVVAVWLMLRYPWARAAFFMLGAFIVFQTSDGISASKLVYFVGVAFAFIVSLVRLRPVLRDGGLQTFRVGVLAALGFLGWMIMVTLPYSVAVRGIPVTNWLRDAATYLLISAGVVIGAEAASSVTRYAARFMTVGLGLIAAFGFASRWIQARGFGSGDSNSGSSLLSSLAGLTLAVGLAFALALVGRGIRIWWLALGIALLLSVLVTGTRTGVVYILVLVGVIGKRSSHAVPLPKAVMAIAVTAAGSLLALPVAGALFSSQTFVETRLRSIVTTLQNGFASDQSGAVRTRAYEYAATIWHSHLLLGQGFGATFPDPSTGGPGTAFQLDTPLTYLAKFGLLGCMALLGTLVLIYCALLRRSVGVKPVVEQTAVRGALFILIGILPLGVPTEDKGFSVTMCLAFILVGSAIRAERAQLGEVASAEFASDASRFAQIVSPGKSRFPQGGASHLLPRGQRPQKALRPTD
ncbi:hypothetical protein DEI93_02690 [Curtobacterium sp. MCBD17_035]|uniref:hypothetical protein n=1 Tax=Curtobacterium sp. MCBD17_035 TaxID=2175673 RepID=UPI000DB36371|nr:hypothetical protein [Curtobacterium sp. MCBD17_035]WIB67968.1 hypothetical protein DEI93_02690 [Curtobacterium sp. MCBD17_035]